MWGRAGFYFTTNNSGTAAFSVLSPCIVRTTQLPGVVNLGCLMLESSYAAVHVCLSEFGLINLFSFYHLSGECT